MFSRKLLFIPALVMLIILAALILATKGSAVLPALYRAF
jgi:hypothetical protein